MPDKKYTVLFVCLGNICRSPAAEEILRAKAKELGLEEQIYTESCGVGAWSVGALPDPRMREAAQARGLNLMSRVQKFDPTHFEKFDYILTVDEEIRFALYNAAKEPGHKAKVQLITAFSDSYPNQEIPDPYHGGSAGFDRVLDMLEDACDGLIRSLFPKKA